MILVVGVNDVEVFDDIFCMVYLIKVGVGVFKF